MTTGINYGGLTDEYILRYQSRYNNPTYTNYAANAKAATATVNGQYASGIQDAGFAKNTCTDGNDDGKIGFGSALLNAGEGILKGALNGFTGLLGFGKDANGKTTWNPLKLIGSVALVAASIACPAIGVAACAVGAVAGGVQVVKGATAAANAKTDAEAKAAWENMGEGGATVVGCIVGAKASAGAMKGSSTAAIDDALKALDNGDDVVKALKGVDAGNIDDVTSALNKAGIDNIDEVNNVIGKFGADTSALGNLDDSLTGMEKATKTVKAFGKDALSSTKNNGAKAWKLAKTGLDTVDEYAKAGKANRQAQKEFSAADEALKNGTNLPEDELEALKVARDMAKNDADAASQALKDTKIGGKINEYQTAKQNVKSAKAKIKELDGTKVKDADINALLQQREAAVAELDAAKAKTPFGKLTAGAKETKTYQSIKSALTQDEQASVLKNIKNIKLKDVASNLWGDGKAIFTSLQENQNIQAVISEYGYDSVMEVLKVVYASGQVEQIV